MTTALPNHLILKILNYANLDIDTRLALRMRPGKVERLISDKSRGLLHAFIALRIRRNIHAFASSNILCAFSCHIGQNKKIYVSVRFMNRSNRVVMHFGKFTCIDRVHLLGGIGQYSVSCDVNTGEIIID